MKLTVLTWLRDSSISLIGRIIEIVFRILLFCLPLGVYLLLIQARDKASKVSSISVYTTDDSVWQHIFPGFILVAVNPNSFKNSFNSIKLRFQQWVNNNKYELTTLFMAVVVGLLLWIGK